MSESIAFIGAGNMGGALVEAICRGASADQVTIYDPSKERMAALAEKTGCIVTAENLAHVKPGTLFINTARSEVIESGALLARLQKGDVPAALDVFDHEPLTADDAICHVPGIVLTPHIGWRADGAFKELPRPMIACLTAYFAGEDYNVVVSER